MNRVIILIISLLLVSCSQYGPEQIKGLELIDGGALLIDVRTKQEFEEEHLNNAINVEYENIPKLIKTIGHDKERSVVLYCRSGRRASVALDELKRVGYNHIYNAQALKKLKAAEKARQKQQK